MIAAARQRARRAVQRLSLTEAQAEAARRLLRDDRRQLEAAEDLLAECRRELRAGPGRARPDSAAVLELTLQERLLAGEGACAVRAARAVAGRPPAAGAGQAAPRASRRPRSATCSGGSAAEPSQRRPKPSSARKDASKGRAGMADTEPKPRVAYSVPVRFRRLSRSRSRRTSYETIASRVV